jgi:phage terminase small subunit
MRWWKVGQINAVQTTRFADEYIVSEGGTISSQSWRYSRSYSRAGKSDLLANVGIKAYMNEHPKY